MATLNKFNDFSNEVTRGIHNFGTDTFKFMLTNTLPISGNSVKNDIPEISAGNGYVSGGQPLTITITSSAGVTTVYATQIAFTASGGSIGPFQYGVIYNDSSINKNLVGWFDYGQTLTLQDSESITVKFNNSTPGAIFQLA